MVVDPRLLNTLMKVTGDDEMFGNSPPIHINYTRPLRRLLTAAL